VSAGRCCSMIPLSVVSGPISASDNTHSTDISHISAVLSQLYSPVSEVSETVSALSPHRAVIYRCRAHLNMYFMVLSQQTINE